MARKTLYVSDMSGQPIEDNAGAVVTVKYNDSRRGTIVLDLTDEEAQAIAQHGRRQARRGRPPKSQN